jgi:hypothetical protein
MPSLLELQGRFAAALDDPRRSAPRGIDVYRHAIAANYRRALAASFPVVRARMGDEAFERAVDAFVAAEPPVSGDLNVYGDGFAHFLAGRADAAGADFLADLARLEWAIDESMRAPDHEGDAATLIADLAVLEEDAIASQRLRLHPSCRLVEASHAVFDVWSAHQRGEGESPRGAPAQPRKSWILVRRDGARPLVEDIAAAEFAWLSALREGASFGDALGRALAIDEAFDLAGVLHARVYDRTISALAA